MGKFNLLSEIRHFSGYPRNMKILLTTNMIYSLVLPVIELFIGTYIMRNSENVIYVVSFQLAQYTGIPITFLINGFLLRKIPIRRLYSFGMLLSGISMAIMMSLGELEIGGIICSGLIMGLSYGFFWANRDFLALASTNNGNRNYYYGLESFFYTLSGVIVPYAIGSFIGATENGFLNGNVNFAYQLLTCCVFALTICSSACISQGGFRNPKSERFVYFKFDKLWNKMMVLSGLKGIAQGYIVTAPAMLIMLLVGNENTLGIVQSSGAVLSAIMLYILGRITKPKHRLLIFIIGLSLFTLGGILNANFYSSTGVVLFMICLLLGRPLMDMAYFPIQMDVIDHVQRKEKRNPFAYIFIHELGLYAGRSFGCGLFIICAIYISDAFALRYALLLIGLLQLISIFIARDIINLIHKDAE